MSQKIIQVNFETITPLWTGDAWGDNTSIRPSSIMGSLRFWFEVICYFSGITNEHNYENGKLKDDLKKEEFKKKVVVNGADFDGIDKTLAELGISLPSRVFGCTGWKGWVRIKKIIFDPKNFNNDPRGRIIKGKNWFWGSPSYQGIFEVVFEMESEIVGSIFYPLLTFIEKYGFLGGKWNIGYGRVKIVSVGGMKSNQWAKEKFELKKFYANSNSKFETNKNFSKLSDHDPDKNSSILNFVSEFSILEISNDKIKILENQINDQTQLKEIIKKLIQIKATHRHDISDMRKRHNLFGEGGKNAKGTKIIPWIYEDENDLDENGNPKLKGGFLSIAGLLNLEGERDG